MLTAVACNEDIAVNRTVLNEFAERFVDLITWSEIETCSVYTLRLCHFVGLWKSGIEDGFMQGTDLFSCKAIHKVLFNVCTLFLLGMNVRERGQSSNIKSVAVFHRS